MNGQISGIDPLPLFISASYEFLKTLTFVAQDGWSLDDITTELIQDYKESKDSYNLTDEGLLFLEWIGANRQALSSINVELCTAYSGDSDTPVWFGILLDLPHRANFEAVRLTDINQKHMKTLSNFLTLLQKSPAPQEVVIKELDFWSMYSIS